MLAASAVLLAVALGLVLRLADPLSSPVIPAEDPYNHMALVREHLRTGELEALNPNENLYPPGLHAFLAAAWTYTGIELYDIIRFAPVVLGAIGILGMGLLLWRAAGPVAAIVGCTALAVAPEAIFRTTMMSPTALDFALLPFLVYALARTVAGRLAWAGVLLVFALFLAFAHPWLVAILCATAGLFLLTLILFPWPGARGAPVSLLGTAACLAALGVGLAVALTRPGFAGTLKLPDLGHPLPIALAIGTLAVAPLATLLWGRRRAWKLGWAGFAQPPLPVRFALSFAIGVAVLGSYAIATRQGLPMHVDLVAMFGWPILVVAVLTLVALPFVSSPVANLVAALAAVTYPFTVFNPLESEFLSHRTAAFLGLALVALVGIGAGALARLLALAVHHGLPAAAPGKARPARGVIFAAAPALLAVALIGGPVYAATPDAYDGGWYRLYNECEMAGLRDVASMADLVPSAVVVTGDWQAKLVLAALTRDASRVWFAADFYTSSERRETLVAQMEKEGRPLLVVVDRHLMAVTPGADTSSLQSPPFEPAGSWCSNMGVPGPRLTAFATAGVPA